MRNSSETEITVSLVSELLSFFIESWVLMLAVGGLHTHYPALPAFGYGVALLVMLIVSAVGTVARGPSKS